MITDFPVNIFINDNEFTFLLQPSRAPENLSPVLFNGMSGADTCTKEITLIIFMLAFRKVIILCAYKAKFANLHIKGTDWQCYG